MKPNHDSTTFMTLDDVIKRKQMMEDETSALAIYAKEYGIQGYIIDALAQEKTDTKAA